MDYKALKKWIAVGIVGLTLTTSNVLAASTPFYTDTVKFNDDTPVWIQGDLSKSGHDLTRQKAYPFWLEINTKNVSPSPDHVGESNLAGVSYDIFDPTGSVVYTDSGFSVVNFRDKSQLDKMANKYNGNQNFVYRKVSERTLDMKDYYIVNGIDHVHTTAVLKLCGTTSTGFTPHPAGYQKGVSGISRPVGSTTVNMTNWPKISNVQVENGNLTFDAKTFAGGTLSYWVVKGKVDQKTLVDATLTRDIGAIVNTDYKILPGTWWQEKTMAASRTHTVESIQALNGDDATNQDFTIVVSDAFERISVTPFTLGPTQPNLSVTALDVQPVSPKKNEAATINAKVKNTFQEEITSPVVLEMDGKQVGEQMVTLSPEQEKTITFPVTMPDVAQTIVKATINPDRDQPKNESTWDDNSKQRTISLVGEKLNLTVTRLEADPSSPRRKDRAVIRASIKNQSNQVISSPLVLQLDGKQVGEQTIVLDPGEEKQFPFMATMPDATKTIAKAVVNPKRNQPAQETTFEDNTKELTIPLLDNGKLGRLNLVLTWSKGPSRVDHKGAFSYETENKWEYRAFYKNPKLYDVTVSAYNDSSLAVTTTIKMSNVYKGSVYVVPKPMPCGDDDCEPPKPYWLVSNDIQQESKTITIPAKGEVFVTFTNVRPSYTHTTEKDEDGNVIEEPVDQPRSNTSHDLYFVLNESQNPSEQTYDDNTVSRTIQVNNNGEINKRGILTK